MCESQKEQISVSEQIERTSVNIITFSALQPESGLPLNIPNILGGEDIIQDEVAKLKVQEAFGQLNIQSVFGMEGHVFQSCLYDTFHVGDKSGEKLRPHIYLLKSHANDVYLLNLLITPYADLNLDSYFNEVEFMSRSFSGVFRRTNAQIDLNDIDEEQQIDICSRTVDNLSGFLHHEIFNERGLRDKVSEEAKTSTAMVCGMFFEVSIDQSEYQCSGDCGKTFEQDDAQFEDDQRSICPNCGDPLVKAPPILKLDNVQFVLPHDASTYLSELGDIHDNPTKYLSYVTGIIMPRNITLTTNRLSPEHFSSLVAIPSKASFESPIEGDTYLSLSFNWRERGDKIFLFCSVGNSAFANRPELPFIAQLTANVLNRQIVEGFEKDKSLPDIIKSSIVSDWKLTEKIGLTSINKYQSLADLPKEGTL